MMVMMIVVMVVMIIVSRGGDCDENHHVMTVEWVGRQRVP